MKLVPENINEAIKHLPGRSEEEIEYAYKEILDDCGYKPKNKKEILKAIKLELEENKRRLHKKPVEFLSSNLNYIAILVRFDFNPDSTYKIDTMSMVSYLADDLKRLIEKYNLNK